MTNGRRFIFAVNSRALSVGKNYRQRERRWGGAAVALLRGPDSRSDNLLCERLALGYLEMGLGHGSHTEFDLCTGNFGGGLARQPSVLRLNVLYLTELLWPN